MITSDHLEDVSLELGRVQELMAALELATDGLVRGESFEERLAFDATHGVFTALKRQTEQTRTVLDGLFPIALKTEGC